MADQRVSGVRKTLTALMEQFYPRKINQARINQIREIASELQNIEFSIDLRQIIHKDLNPNAFKRMKTKRKTETVKEKCKVRIRRLVR